MAYIGRGTENISNVEVLDNLTFNGSASYTLQKSSTNFVPSSANNLLISISGVVQQGNFTVSGSTITFDTTVASSDTCDWILHYGTGLITTVADGAITEAKLGNNAVTASKIDSSVALGKIGQVIHASTVTQVTDTAASHIDTGLSATITPTSTSSKILIHIAQAFGKNSNNTQVDANLQRDSTVIVSEWLNDDIRTGDATTLFPGHSALCWLDSPSTTSAVTYKTTFRNAAASGTVYAQGNNSRSSIILMEVLA